MAEPIPSRELEPLVERLHGAANILVLGSSFDGHTSNVCADLCAGIDPPSATVLGVTYRRSPAEWVDDWQRHAGTAPAHGHVIGVGDWQQSTTPTAGGPDRWSMETVERASDLTRLGIGLSEFLAGARDSSTVEEIRVCFDSVTALLQYADVKRTFQFLHVVTGRVKSAEAVAHYHLDPAAHDEQTLATLRGLFDAIVEVDDAGEWTLQRR